MRRLPDLRTVRPASGRIRLRPATRADADALLALVTALAQFEKLSPPDRAARHRFIRHGFGRRRLFETWLAFWDGADKPVGYAIFFQTYSSFLARPTLYLEDLFVLPDYRQRGIGSALFRQCVQLARQRECGRMEWTCLDWNRKAQAFYQRAGARRLAQWHIYRLSAPAIDQFLRNRSPTIEN